MIDFNERLNSYLAEKEKKKENTNYETNNIRGNDFFKSQILDFENKIKRTKFNKRVVHVLNDNESKINFLLDNRFICDIEYSDFLFNYNAGDLAEKVIEQLYLKENAYTLIEFLEKECYKSDTKLSPRFRIDYDDFVKQYMLYTEKRFGANKVVNLKKIKKLLKVYFNCDFIKYENKNQLTNITTLDIYREQTNKNFVYSKDKGTIISNFVEEFCIVNNYIEPSQRITRADFRKVFKLYLKKENLSDIHIKNQEFKDILLDEFDEPFIKSNGIWYMKKIKFKNFN